MSSSKFEKIVKIMLWVLMIVSAGITAWGYAVGFSDASVNTLFYWAYVLMVVGVAAALLFGVAISAINNPKNLIKMGIELVAVVIVVGAVYLRVRLVTRSSTDKVTFSTSAASLLPPTV